MIEAVAKSMALNNGVVMPTLGLGVYRMLEGPQTEQSVKWALGAGYRLIDTAKFYGNEGSVGKAIQASGVPRNEVFVTTKLWPTDFLHPEAAFERSMRKLNLGYIDLYLVHFPIPYVPKKVWRTFEKLYAEKRVRAIGVSNYNVVQIERLMSWCSVPPAVNQIRFNPFSYKKELLEFCQSKNIVIEAHTPLAKGEKLNNETIRNIAETHGRSLAQIAIRWALQHGTIVIPKSVRREHIEQNLQVFDFKLNFEEMQRLDALSD